MLDARCSTLITDTAALRAVLLAPTSSLCSYLRDARTNQPWTNPFLHRSTLLANESWTDRKGANDRDRGDLLFTIRLCSHSVVAALGTKALTLAYLRRVLDLSWLGLLAKGPSHVLCSFILSL